MITYLPDSNEPSKTFELSYRDLRNHYEVLCGLRDDEFIARLPEALHVACFICYLKEVPTVHTLGDYGIIHLIAHQLHMGDDATTKGELTRLRDAFRDTLKLA